MPDAMRTLVFTCHNRLLWYFKALAARACGSGVEINAVVTN